MKKSCALAIGVFFILLQSTWIMVELRFRKTTDGLREFLNFVTEDTCGVLADILFPLTLISWVWGILLCYQILTHGPNEKISTIREFYFKGAAGVIALFALWDAGYNLTGNILTPLSLGPLRICFDLLLLVFAYRYRKKAKETRSASLQRLIRETSPS